jgi:uncharacterized protein YcfJ
LAGEPEVRKKPDVWKRVVIFGGAILGGLIGWYTAGASDKGIATALGAVIGAWIASYIWDFSGESDDCDDDCDDKSRAQKSGDPASGRGTSP